jgi:uncharacterized surface protein with fasciclin (FAS1) repeats
MFNSRLFTLLFAFALVAFVGCADADEPEVEEVEPTETMDDTLTENTILDVAEDMGLTTFRTAVAQANLDETLASPGPFTIFAPSDEAFNALPEGTLESLLQEENRDQLTNILTYHVLPRSVMSGELSGEMTVNTVQGQELTINAAEGTVTVTGQQGTTATVVSADNEAGNGVIHVIDAVLMPGEGEEMMEGEDTM